jgi:hypothetical protein
MRTQFDTLEQVIDAFPKDVKKFAIDGDAMSDRLYESLYDLYSQNGEMPYGVAKARDDDPMEWVADRFYVDVQDYMDVPAF